MKLLLFIILLLWTLGIYAISLIPLSFWAWFRLLFVLTVFSCFVFPYILAWIINLFFSKGKRFSLSMDKLSPLSLNAKNIHFSFALKKFQITGSLKRVAIHTNFRKALQNIVDSSPFILEIDTLAIGIIPKARTADAVKSSEVKKNSKSGGEIKDKDAEATLQREKSDNVGHSKGLEESIYQKIAFLRYILTVFRLLDFHINSLILSVGDSEFPKRIEVSIVDAYLNGSIQFTPSTTVSGIFSIRSITVKNREDAFDHQPNVSLHSFWIRLSCDLQHRVLIKQLTWNIGDSLHICIDKSLYRQLYAVMKAIRSLDHHFDSTTTVSQITTVINEQELNEESAKLAIVDKISQLIILLPQVIKIILPKFELDLVNADKSSCNTHTSIHILFGFSIKCSTTYYDTFCSNPHGITLMTELSSFKSSFLSCDGIDFSVSLFIRETRNRLESLSFTYNHKKTELKMRPTFMRTLEYIQSMIIRLPIKKNDIKQQKQQQNKINSNIISLLKECSLKVDFRIDELILSILASPHIISSIIEISLQSITIIISPTTTRSSTETYLSSYYELQSKIGSFEVKTIPYSRNNLLKVLSKIKDITDQSYSRLPLCNEKIISFGIIELNCTLHKWKTLTIELILKSCNITLSYIGIDLLLFINELFINELKEYYIRNQNDINNNISFDLSSPKSSTSQQSNILNQLNIYNNINDNIIIDPLINTNNINTSYNISSPTIIIDNIQNLSPIVQNNYSVIDTPILLETMTSEEINYNLLQSILDGSLFPDGMNDVVDIMNFDIPGLPFTPSSSPQPQSITRPHTASRISTVLAQESAQESTSSSLSPVQTISSKTKTVKASLVIPKHIKTNSNQAETISDSESDEILLSEEEIMPQSEEATIYQFLPIYLTDLSLRINSVEIQITGCDTARSTSYSMECLNITITTKNIDSMERYLTPILSIPTDFSEVINTPSFSHLPLYTPTSPSLSIHPSLINYHGKAPILSPIDEQSNGQLPSIPLDLDCIPELITNTSNTMPSLPVSPMIIGFRHSTKQPIRLVLPQLPLLQMNHLPSLYIKNAGIEYTVNIEITNISIVGEEGINIPKTQLPLYIPQIRIIPPPLYFISMTQSQLPHQLTDFVFTISKTEYSAKRLSKWNGFQRGDESLVLISANNRDSNCFQIEFSSLFSRLSFGSIYVFYHSIVDLINILKTNTINKTMNEIKEMKNDIIKEKINKKINIEQIKKVNTMKSSLSSPYLYRIMITLRQNSITFHFTPKAGLHMMIEEISLSYPDCDVLPLLSIRNIQVSQIQMTQIICSMVNISSISVHSPSCYSEVSSKNGLDANSKSISELRDRSLYITKCTCGLCDSCRRYMTCSTCKKQSNDNHICNGYDNQCNLRVDHIPINILPYLIMINKVDCVQDMHYQWGDLIYDACLQWKAFKTIRKGIKSSPLYPHSDEQCYQTVIDHEPYLSSSIFDGVWIQLIADSILIRLQDIIPHISPDTQEYSCFVLSGLDGVVTYNKKLHSRSHLLQYIQQMDETTTPFAKGFDDVLGLHLHDIYIDSIETTFADQPPLCAACNLYVCGTFVLADMNRVESYIRYETVDLFCSSSFDPLSVQVIRSSISTKFYQNFNIQAKQMDIFWGSPLWWVRNSFSNGFGALTPRGISKSPKMCWYDKIRFSLHGQISLQVFNTFRIDWVTYKCIEDQYESLVIESTNPTILFRKEGGSSWEFDVFSIGVSKFDSTNQLILSPLFQAVEGAWQFNLKWCNKDTINHYIELNDQVSDDIDKYLFYRSNTIEWKIILGPYCNRDFNSSFFMRAELVEFLMDFWNMICSTNPDFPVDYTPGLMRNSTSFDIQFIMNNSSFWLFIDDSSDNGFNLIAKKFEFSTSMYKLLPKYLEQCGQKDLMNQSEKPDYSELQYSYDIYSQSNWIFPRIYNKLEDLILNHLSLQQIPQFPMDQPHYTPFIDANNIGVMLVAKLSKVGILKGVNPSSSGFDEDIADMYNEKIRGINGKVTEKYEGRFAIFLKGLKMIYSLDIRDAGVMCLNDLRTIYQSIYSTRKPASSTPSPTHNSPIPVTQHSETSTVLQGSSSNSPYPMSNQSSTNSRTNDPIVHQRTTVQKAVSISRNNQSDPRRDSFIYTSIGLMNRSVSNTSPNFLYRNESSYFSNHFTRDSLRFSMGLGPMNKYRSDLTRSSNASFYRPNGETGNAVLGRLMSTRSVSGVVKDTGGQVRRAKRDEIFKQMKEREKEAQNDQNTTLPQLLSYLLKKANHSNQSKEGNTLVFTEDDTITRRDETHKEEKENFILDVMFKDSQIHIASIETGGSLLLYLYKGSMIVQKKPVQQREYYILNTNLAKVDLFLGGKRAVTSPWISTQDINPLNTIDKHIGIQGYGTRTTRRPFKRIIQDFSLSLITRSQNGFIPSRITSPTFRREDLVNRITVNIGSFSVRMTGDEFYHFLNVIRYTLLVNPTNNMVVEQKETQSVKHLRERMSTLTDDLLKNIKKKVVSMIRGDNEMIPVMRIKYTLEEVEWILLASKDKQIAIATLRGLTGEHNFCFDGKTESKITLNDMKIINPTTSVHDQKWEYPELIFSPVTIDRAKDDQSNFLEIITVMSNSFVCDSIPVNVFEHVGINVFPGCHYYILFQISTSVVAGIYRYFFPEEEEEEEGLITERTPREGVVDLSSIDDNESVTSSSTLGTQSHVTHSDDFSVSTQARLPNLQVGRRMDRKEIILELDDENNSIDLSTEVSPATEPSAKNRFNANVALHTAEDIVTTLRTRKSSNVSDSSSSVNHSSHNRFNHKQSSCEHEFEITDQPGVCVVCHKKIAHVRHLGYKCIVCGVMVDQNCREKAMGRDPSKKTQQPRQLIFLEHMRIGTVELVISARGIRPLNLNNFGIVLQHQIYSSSLTTWAKLFKMIKKTYTTEVLKFAPSYVFRGWGFRNSSKRTDKREKIKFSRSSNDTDELTDDKKITLLLGNDYFVQYSVYYQ